MKFSSKARNVFLLAGILFLSMLSRLIFSPLLIYIREDLNLTQSQAGSLFLVISLGYSPGMLFSGFLTARTKHCGAIKLSLVIVAFGLTVAALSPSYYFILAGLWLIGIGAGLYPPSGIATITDMISPARTGQALAVHEMGPTIAFCVAPLLALFFHHIIGWRGIVLLVAGFNLIAMLAYSRKGNGGDFYGKPPHFKRLLGIVRDPAAWFCFFLFCMALSSMQGLYSILPMYLSTGRGLNPDRVNTLISISRISSIFVLLISGTLVDKFGARPVLMTAFFISGAATLFLGLTAGTLLEAAVIVQPALLSAFFPAGLMALSKIGPPESKNVTLSVVINFAVFFGNGIVPTFFGWLGDRDAVPFGFLLLGVMMLVTVALLYKNREFGEARA
jgi:NNP family nitrate/nitrite transporter-like MFS transporter